MSAHPFEFEKSLKELEDITAWFESPDVDLDAGLDKFERGMELAARLKDHLASVENRGEKMRQRFSAKASAEPLPAGEAEAAYQPDAQTDTDSTQTGLFGA